MRLHEHPQHAGASALILLEPSVQDVLDLPQALQLLVGLAIRGSAPCVCMVDGDGGCCNLELVASRVWARLWGPLR